MKNLNLLISMVLIVNMISSCEKDNNKNFNFTEYPDYFASYQNNIDIQGEFFVFNDTSELNLVFHPATTMDNQIWINQNDFKNKVAIGIIKEFNNVCSCPEMTIKSIELIDKKVVYKYSLTGIDNSGDIGCDMVCRPNLLVMIDKDSFTLIDFYENDILVKTINK